MRPLNLKDFKVIKQIGQGGMGIVYLAEDLTLGRLVALKVLAPYLVQDPQIMERFRAEARSQARLTHPHITTVYSFQEMDQQAFLVLEFIDGETLEQRIQRYGRIVTTDTVAIFRKILSAIDYAHNKGVIHRDIKPSNIAFTQEGVVKLMDFGISLNVEESGRLTRTGHILGTPHYMAPEQILGQPLDFRTDIYALGITLYETLTGKLPFNAKSDHEIRVAQINQPPPPLIPLGHPDITPALEEVVFKALAKKQADRFASALEFLKSLDRAVHPEQARPATHVLKMDKSTHRLTPAREAASPQAATGRVQGPAPSLKGRLPTWGRWWYVPLIAAPLIVLLVFGASLFSGLLKSGKGSPPGTTAISGGKGHQHPQEKAAATPAPTALAPKSDQATQPGAPEPRPVEVAKKSREGPPPESPSSPAPGGKQEVEQKAATHMASAPEAREKTQLTAALSTSEKKSDIPPAREPKPPNPAETLKKKFKEQGFSGIKVVLDAENRVVISGRVKAVDQRNRILQIVNDAKLTVPVDYKNLTVMKEVAAKPVKKVGTKEAAPKTPEKPKAPERAGKPLPPRLDPGNLQF